MAARSRYAEDELARAVAHGVTQYVILGAGLDTFAYRNPHPGLRVFEVDHPATQAWKREQLQAAGIPIPPSLTFVPIDFEQQTLEAGLEHSGFDTNAAAFFSWLGVTPYLTHEACMTTLCADRQNACGQRSSFRFRRRSDAPQSRPKAGARRALETRGRSRRAFPAILRPRKLQDELKSLGFRRTEFLQGEQINARYFKDRADGLQVRGGLGHLMGAWV